MEKLSFHLEVFEGPLDLLLHLISKNKVNIYDIPIASITDQYFEAIQIMKDLDLEVSSEFSVMASSLLLIKSKMLLPKSADDEEEDPRAELVEKLLEYQRYKQSAAFLKEHEFAYKYMIFKKPDDIEPVYMEDDTIYPIDKLIDAFNDLLERSKRRVPPPRKTFEGIIKRENVSLKERISYVAGRIEREKKIMFYSLFDGMRSKSVMVATFLALLELIKINVIAVSYNREKCDFVLKATGNSLPDDYNIEKE